MSLDAAEVDLSQAFEKGMGYVALSRVRTLGGLSLKGMNKTALMVDEEVLAFDEHFRTASREHAEDLRKETAEEISNAHKNFIERIAPIGGKKEKKPDTLEETKKLLSEGKSLAEIALARELKEGTIIDHLEKLKEQDHALDLSALEKSLPKARREKITQALLKGGQEGGVYKLTPAKILLGFDFSFEEIRLARLFLKK